MRADAHAGLDCLIIGGGPAGLTAALYLARFRRRFALIDTGDARAGSIPVSHNIPFFADGIAGPEILARQRAALEKYGSHSLGGLVTSLRKANGLFEAEIDGRAGRMQLHPRRVLLATGAADVEPDLPGLPNAIRRGLLRYCPICDGYEAAGKKIAVIGFGAQGLAEAEFLARTYSGEVTLLTLGSTLDLDADQLERVRDLRITVVREPIADLEVTGDRITALKTGMGPVHRFDVLYSALGLKPRSSLALSLGARCDDKGALEIDEHNQTTVPGLYAAGGVVRGLDQVVVAMGHAAIAATDIHNRCHLPTEDEF
jgi:thioredoxin reductase (NADPH)